MIYSIGDSHAEFSFRNIPEISRKATGALTLKRVGNAEDNELLKIIEKLNPQPNDMVIFCFGEIDIRCHVKPLLDHRSGITLESLLTEWVDNYIHKIETLNMNGALRIISSVVPPVKKDAPGIHHSSYPVMGSDEERVLYTQKINELFLKKCQEKNWLFLDICSKYKNEAGMLDVINPRDTMHITNTEKVRELLVESKLIP